MVQFKRAATPCCSASGKCTRGQSEATMNYWPWQTIGDHALKRSACVRGGRRRREHAPRQQANVIETSSARVADFASFARKFQEMACKNLHHFFESVRRRARIARCRARLLCQRPPMHLEGPAASMRLCLTVVSQQKRRESLPGDTTSCATRCVVGDAFCCLFTMLLLRAWLALQTTGHNANGQLACTAWRQLHGCQSQWI
jgi:hypothetical protein